jgi:hypothetical protein
MVVIQLGLVTPHTAVVKLLIHYLIVVLIYRGVPVVVAVEDGAVQLVMLLMEPDREQAHKAMLVVAEVLIQFLQAAAGVPGVPE